MQSSKAPFALYQPGPVDGSPSAMWVAQANGDEPGRYSDTNVDPFDVGGYESPDQSLFMPTRVTRRPQLDQLDFQPSAVPVPQQVPPMFTPPNEAPPAEGLSIGGLSSPAAQQAMQQIFQQGLMMTQRRNAMTQSMLEDDAKRSWARDFNARIGAPLVGGMTGASKLTSEWQKGLMTELDNDKTRRMQGATDMFNQVKGLADIIDKTDPESVKNTHNLIKQQTAYYSALAKGAHMQNQDAIGQQNANTKQFNSETMRTHLTNSDAAKKMAVEQKGPYVQAQTAWLYQKIKSSAVGDGVKQAKVQQDAEKLRQMAMRTEILKQRADTYQDAVNFQAYNQSLNAMLDYQSALAKEHGVVGRAAARNVYDKKTGQARPLYDADILSQYGLGADDEPGAGQPMPSMPAPSAGQGQYSDADILAEMKRRQGLRLKRK